MVATGGLSHEPGGPRYFWVDEEFDRWFLDLLKRGDHDTLLRECTLERMEAAGSGGTAELLAWVLVLAFTRGPADVLAYMPAIAWRSGTGMVVWNDAPDGADMPTTHKLDAQQVHHEWNNAIPPRLEIDPGDTVVFDTRDAADQLLLAHLHARRRPGARAVPRPSPHRTGARCAARAPGDTLVVEILDVRPALDFGWTAIRPGRGLLPESDFAKPYLNIWDLADGVRPHGTGRSRCRSRRSPA